jgi:hypothetical protein
MQPLLIEGMHGLGDNIHQRAIIRQLMQDNEIWLRTSWPSVYHDLDIHLVAGETQLRTQLKNQKREADKFERQVRISRHTRILYSPEAVRETGSVLGAMCKETRTNLDIADFRLPIPAEWEKKARAILSRVKKQVMIYRPLVERREWKSTAARNPDIEAYDALFRQVRGRYYVISLADLADRQEWIVSKPVRADREFHAGELDFETMAALFKLANLVFTAPGFAVPLAQAVGTQVISVFGGYESSRSFSAGAKYAPYLGIDTINPCECFSATHKCDKRMDIELAKARIEDFLA